MARGKTVDLAEIPVEHSEEAIAPKPRGGGARPFTPLEHINQGLQSTYENGGSAVLPGIPVDAIGSAKSQIRRHAKALNLSASFDVVDHGNGTVDLKFMGGKKREYKSRKPREAETVDA